ncbi:MAG TPA: hypothetical protein VMW91_09575 [Desulfosporosinus sp.]|nr:hypothetical protein [Desulfosporosinus sp.]
MIYRTHFRSIVFSLFVVAFWMYSALATEGVSMVQIPKPEDDIFVSAPINTESAGKAVDIAEESVVRVICTDRGSGGTGFLHSSGKIITAAHVVKIKNLVFSTTLRDPMGLRSRCRKAKLPQWFSIT